MPTDDEKGRPLIQQIPDLLASAVFVANLSYRTTEDDIYKHFESIGKVNRVQVQVYSKKGKKVMIERGRGRWRGRGRGSNLVFFY